MSALRLRGLTVPWSHWRRCSGSSFRSDISLDRLYPARETVQVSPPDLSSAVFTGHINMEELTTSCHHTAVDIR